MKIKITDIFYKKSYGIILNVYDLKTILKKEMQIMIGDKVFKIIAFERFMILTDPLQFSKDVGIAINGDEKDIEYIKKYNEFEIMGV